jgi:hypothetical protein
VQGLCGVAGSLAFLGARLQLQVHPLTHDALHFRQLQPWSIILHIQPQYCHPICDATCRVVAPYPSSTLHNQGSNPVTLLTNRAGGGGHTPE